MKIWTCKIGEVEGIPDGADLPMRQAVAEAYKRITGKDPKFIFSDWGGTLTSGERAVVEGRHPVTICPACGGSGADPTQPINDCYECRGRGVVTHRPSGHVE